METKNNLHALTNQEKWIVLSRKEVKHIFVYYLILLAVALISTVCFIFYFTATKSADVKLGLICIFAFINGILGSTFYYIRKLYKTCIQQLVIEDSKADALITSLGAKAYFYFRPIMGATLALLIILGVYGGFFVLFDQPAINADKFFVFVAIFSFLVGFSNGKIILKIDNSTSRIAEMISVHKGVHDE